MKKHRKPESFIEPISYPGGTSAMRLFISSNLRYPEKALQNRTEGIVVVKTDIDSSGKVISAQVIKSIADGCDEEALRLVKMMKFNPIKHKNGLRVTYHKNININFALRSTTSEQSIEIKINFQPALPKNKPTEGSGVTYTIRIAPGGNQNTH